MEKATIIGLDLAESVFWHPVPRQTEAFSFTARAQSGVVIFCGAAWLLGCDGGLRQCASLGSVDPRSGSRGAPDTTCLCEAIRQAAE